MRKISTDQLYKIVLTIFGIVIIILVVGIFLQLIIGSLPSIKANGIHFLFKTVWDPNKDVFGAFPFLYGTLITSLIAVLLSLPLCIGTSLFLIEYLSVQISDIISTGIDLLAAIPSVVYGLWGLFVLVPVVRVIEEWLYANLSFIPIFNAQPYGVGILSAILVLLIMILPYAISVIKEVLKLVPTDIKEAAYALGATKWEVLQKVVIPYIKPGIFAGIGLSLGRALGETMAVTMLIGNRNSIPTSIFDPANTLASIIANDFYEASSRLHTSSLLYLGLILLIITFFINLLMRYLLMRTSKLVAKK